MPRGVPGSKAEHGTRTRYNSHKCRCDECRAARTTYERERSGATPRAEYLASASGDHGHTGMSKRCKCDVCRAAASAARRERRERAAERAGAKA